MNSKFANLFTAIQTRMAAEVPEVIWTDFDLGQLESFDGERPPVEWPCVLIDFPDTAFTQMQGYQHGDVQVQLRLAFDEYEDTHSATPTPIKESALEYLEIEHKLHQAFQAWYASGLLVNAMIRVSAATEKRENDNFRVRRLVYTCSFADNDPD